MTWYEVCSDRNPGGGMTEQLALQSKLRDQFLEFKNRNPSFSLRAFAKRLQVSPSALSEILQGKRRVSRNLAEQILGRLCVDPKDQQRILSLFKGSRGSSQLSSQFSSPVTSEDEKRYLELSADQFQLISKWHHFALLSLSETKGFVADPLWVAKRLGIPYPEAERTLERLERLGFIQWSRSRKILKPLKGQLATSDDIANQAIRQSHFEDIDLSKRALETVPIEDRDFTALTLAIDKTKLPQAKKLIRDFQNQLMAFLESGEQTEVYKICFHVLPLSRALGVNE